MNKLVQTGDKGYTLAWNPVTQSEAFRIPSPRHFQGGATDDRRQPAGAGHDGAARSRSIAPTTAKSCGSHATGSVPVAGPITYSVKGKQYIAVNAGWNNAIVHGTQPGSAQAVLVGPARLVVYALDAKGVRSRRRRRSRR